MSLFTTFFYFLVLLITLKWMSKFNSVNSTRDRIARKFFKMRR